MSLVIFSVMHIFVEEHITGTTDVTYWKVKPLVLDAMECYGHEDYILSRSYYPVQENIYLLCAVDAQFQSNPVQTGPSMALCKTPEAVYLLGGS